MNFHCVNCRQSTETIEPHEAVSSIGRKMMKGVCGSCGRKKSTFIKGKVEPQEGEGLFGNIKKGIKKGLTKGLTKGRNVVEKRKDDGLSRPLYDGEQHLPKYNYCGGRTQVNKRLARGDKPINAEDNACMGHDIDYLNIAKNRKNIGKKELATLVREADKRLVDNLDRIPGNKSLDSRIIKASMKGKAIAEDLGVLAPDMYVSGSGRKTRKGKKTNYII